MFGKKNLDVRRACAALLLVVILGFVSVAGATAAAPNAGLSIGMPIHDIAFVKSIAQPGDMYRGILLDTSVTQSQQLLSQIPLANRMVQTCTTVGLDANLSKLTVPVTWLGFDFEGWSQSSAWEHANQVAAVKLASDIAHKHGMKLVLMTTHAWTKNYGKQMAPYVDVFIPQAKGIMANNTPAQYAALVRPVWIGIKQANPNMKLWMDVSPQPKTTTMSPAQMESYVDQVRDLVSGVWITHTTAYKTVTANFIRTYWGR